MQDTHGQQRERVCEGRGVGEGGREIEGARLLRQPRVEPHNLCLERHNLFIERGQLRRMHLVRGSMGLDRE